MKLQSVHLWNFRSHSEYVLNFPDKGIIAISGENGSGKSSIVNGIAWCLYGTKPDGVKKASALVKHGTVFNKDTLVGVEVVLEDSDGVLRIRRTVVNKTGNVECRVWDKDDVLLAGPAVSFADRFLATRLQFTEDSFLTGCFVQQKQVDAILLASTARRREIFESLTGVSAITEAIARLREELNSLTKGMELSAVDTDLLDLSRIRLRDLKKAYLQKQEQKDKLSEKLNTLKVNAESAKETADNLVDEFTTQEKYRILVEESSQASLQEQIRGLLSRKKQLSSGGVGDLEKTPEVVQAEYDKISEECGEIERLLKAAKTLKKEAVNAKAIISEIGTTDVAAVQQKCDKIAAKLKSVNDAMVAQKSAMTPIRDAIKAAQQTNDATCPSCGQDIGGGDTVTFLQNRLEHIQRAAVKNSETLKKGAAVQQKALDLLADEKKKESRLRELAEVVKLWESTQQTVPELEEQLVNLRAKRSVQKKLLTKVAAAAAILTEIEYIDSSLSTLQQKLEDSAGKESVAKEYLKTHKAVSLTDVDKAKATHEKLAAQLAELSTSFHQVKEEMSNMTGECRQLKKSVAAMEEQENTIQTTLKKKVETKSAIADLVSFRERQATIISPIISATATELTNSFTGGTIVSVKMNQNFSIDVEMSGGNRLPLGLLSGGELSSVAMAVRLATASLLGGGQLLILDEVLVSQDRERADAILAGIKDFFDGQVLLISHSSSLGDMADVTVEL